MNYVYYHNNYTLLEPSPVIEILKCVPTEDAEKLFYQYLEDFLISTMECNNSKVKKQYYEVAIKNVSN